MRIVAFCRKARALGNTETVLFVGHDKPEPREFNVLLQKRVGADGKPDFAGGERGFDFPFLRGGRGAGQKRDFEPCPFKEVSECAVMLFGEHFRRRHNGGLHPVFRRGIHERGGNRGFARPDVALQKAVHRLAGAHIGGGFLHGALLGAGHRKRQKLTKFGESVRLHHAIGFERLGAAFHLQKPELQQKQLVKNQPAARFFERGFVRREMNVVNGGIQCAKFVRRSNILRQNVGNRRVERIEHRAHAFFNRFCRQRRRGRVNRPNRICTLRLLKQRRRHFARAVTVARRFTEKEIFLALF